MTISTTISLRSATSSPALRGRRPGAKRAAVVLAVAAWAFGSCGGGSSGQLLDQGQVGQPGQKTAGGGPYDGNLYLVDPHNGGQSNDFRLVGAAWGRLVDVYDLDTSTGATNLVYPEFVVGQDVRTEPNKWTLSTNAATGVTRLTIHERKTATPGDAFDLLVQESRVNLAPIAPKSLNPGELPPYPLIARNSVLELQFSDLVAPKSVVANDTIKLFTGTPPTVPFTPRTVLSTNYGGLTSSGFHSTRVLLDFTISEFEASVMQSPLPLNGLGLPASPAPGLPNVVLRIPTTTHAPAGQFSILTNLKGSGLNVTTNSPISTSLPTLDVERAMRSGGPTDASNGFLLDLEPPRLITEQPITVTSAFPDPDPNAVPGYDFVVSFNFVTVACGFAPQVEDALRYAGNVTLEVTSPAAVGAGGVVSGARVRANLLGEPLTAGQLVGNAGFITAYRSALSNQAGCFFRFAPAAGSAPTGAVSPQAGVVARFSEPMDPLRVRPFDSFRVVRQPLGTALQWTDYVVGEIVPSGDQREFRFQPSLPFEHTQNNKDYYIDLLTSTALCTDLAGNALQAVPPQVQFRIDPTATAVPSSKGFVMRFANPFLEEIAGGSGAPNTPKDIRGQFLYNSAGFIRPRVPVRIALSADRSQTLINPMGQILTGLITPLSALGSKLQHIYRYADVGMNVSETDDSGMNLDVEGLALSPLNGQVITAFFPQFEIRLAHAQLLPDEILDPATQFPIFPNSGLRDQWATNILNDPIGPQKVVHPRAKGFSVTPSQVFQGPTGIPLLRMPLNLGAVLDSEKQFYTWRDTAVLTRGGVVNGVAQQSDGGVPFMQERLLFGLPLALTAPPAGLPPMFNSGALGGLPPAGGLPSVGLPLLIEYRCFPTETVTLNVFDVSIAVPSQPNPFFRAFATGGIDTGGIPQSVNPDTVPFANGGYNGNPQIAPIGAKTSGVDPTVYMGQIDVVLRVSRVYTRVKQTNAGGSPQYRALVVEPRPEHQPVGTSIAFAFRGGTAAETGNSLNPSTNNALNLNVYGNRTATVSQVGDLAGRPWLTFQQLSQTANIQFLQTRFTFISNTATQLSPILESYALAYQ